MTTKKDPLPGFFFFPQDYFGDALVRLMPPEKRLVWVEMFFLMSESPRRGVLLKKNGQPYTAAELAPICNCSIELVEAAMKHVVDEKIANIDKPTGALLNRRMVRDEIKRIACEKAGKKGWKIKSAKYGKSGQLALPLKDGLSVVPVPLPDPNPKTKYIEVPTVPAAAPEAKSVKYSDDFEKFWEAYPKRLGKGKAWKAWKQNSRPPLEAILQKIAEGKQSKEWRREGGSFIPYPASWLNAHGWNDEYTAAGSDGPGKKPRASLQELEAMAARDFGPLRKARRQR